MIAAEREYTASSMLFDGELSKANSLSQGLKTWATSNSHHRGPNVKQLSEEMQPLPKSSKSVLREGKKRKKD